MKFSQRLALGYIRTKFKLLSSISKKKAAAKAFELFCTPQRRNKKELPKIFKEAESLQFKLDGVTINGWRWGFVNQNINTENKITNADQPPALSKKALIIHGFESSVINFDRYVRPLIKKGYEVLAFDAAAHGRSGGKKITAPLYKRTIQEICKRYGPVNSFMAHSFGGLAVSLALEEISHTKNEKLVLIAPATETTSAIDSFFNFLKLDPSIRPEFDKIIIKAGGVSPDYYSIRRAMKHIRANVLWVHDEDDDTTPIGDVFTVQKENYSNVEFVITKGLGHRRIYRDNKVTKAILEFL